MKKAIALKCGAKLFNRREDGKEFSEADMIFFEAYAVEVLEMFYSLYPDGGDLAFGLSERYEYEEFPHTNAWIRFGEEKLTSMVGSRFYYKAGKKAKKKDLVLDRGLILLSLESNLDNEEALFMLPFLDVCYVHAVQIAFGKTFFSEYEPADHEVCPV